MSTPSADLRQLRTYRTAGLLIRIGGIAVMCALLVMGLALIRFSYSNAISQKHLAVIGTFNAGRELLEARAARLAVFHRRLAKWDLDTRTLNMSPGSATFQAGQTRYAGMGLKHLGRHKEVAGELFVAEPAATALHDRALLRRTLSLLYLGMDIWYAEQAYSHTYLVSDQGDLIGVTPRQSNHDVLVRLLGLRESFRQMTRDGPAWTVLRLQDCANCTDMALVSRISLPGDRLAYSVTTVSFALLNHWLNQPGYFAIRDGSTLLFHSAGFDTSLLPARPPELANEAASVFHPRLHLLVAQRFNNLPWTLYYAPTNQHQSGVEWDVMAVHGILVVLWSALLLLGYFKVRQRIIIPVEHGLASLRRFQRDLAASNRELTHANQQVVQAMSARAMFLAAMSHDIRTPLNGIVAMLDLLARDPLTPRQHNALSVMRDSSDQLLYLVDEILEFTRIQSGKVNFERKPVAPARLLDHHADTLRARLARENQAVTLDYVTTLPEGLVVMLDAHRMNQVVGNLLSNALKFTNQGTIRLECHADGRDPCEIRIIVADTGIGMTAEQRERIFQPFEQADAALTQHYGGAGLGLAICHGLVEQQGGTLTVDSTPGVGSCFTLTFSCPLAGDAAPLPLPLLTGPDRQLQWQGTVLAVEDHPINRVVLAELFGELGIEHVIADSAEQALDWLAQCAAPPTLIISDISLPGMDGYAFANTLAGDSRWSDIPRIAFSAHAFADEISRALDRHFQGYLTKPVTLAKLQKVLGGIAPDSVTLALPSPEPATPVDLAGFISVFGTSRDALHQALDQFITCDSSDLASLNEAVQRGERDTIRRVAHQMAGAAIYVDAGYADRLQELEEIAMEADAAELATLLGEVTDYSQRVREACLTMKNAAPLDSGAA